MQLGQEPHLGDRWVRGEPRLRSDLPRFSRPAGTFITEWKEGERLCEAFLAGDERSYRAVADQLVRIAQFFRFEGWLINVENALSVSTSLSWRRAALPLCHVGTLHRVLGLTRPAPCHGSSQPIARLRCCAGRRTFSSAEAVPGGALLLRLLPGGPFLLLLPCLCFAWAACVASRQAFPSLHFFLS